MTGLHERLKRPGLEHCLWEIAQIGTLSSATGSCPYHQMLPSVLRCARVSVFKETSFAFGSIFVVVSHECPSASAGDHHNCGALQN